MNLKLVDGVPSTKHESYNSWAAMRDRCLNKKSEKWKWYGGRGIKVDEQWDSFEQFVRDVGPRPSRKHSLERVDNDKNYEPGNVIWATQKSQCNNRQTSAFIEIDGQKKTKAQWADKWSVESGIPTSVLKHRVFNLGWSLPDALKFKYEQGQKAKRKILRKRSTDRIIEFDGIKKSLKQWEIETGIKSKNIRNRIDEYGWSIEEALTTPVIKKSNKYGASA